jgi:hypothetical protein
MDNDSSIGSFTFDNGESYDVRFTDWSNAGVMLSVTRPNADHYIKESGEATQRVMLSCSEFDRFLRWASKTCGRPAFVLPPKTRAVLERIRSTGTISRRSRRVLTKAISALKNLEEELTLAQRSLNR